MFLEQFFRFKLCNVRDKKDIFSGAVVAITGCMHNIKTEDELNFSYFLSKLKCYMEEVFIYCLQYI